MSELGQINDLARPSVCSCISCSPTQHLASPLPPNQDTTLTPVGTLAYRWYGRKVEGPRGSLCCTPSSDWKVLSVKKQR